MQLRLESRPVGDVLVMQCHGRIVAGNEVFTLHARVGDAIEKYGDVVLQLDEIEFVDSSGLGALVRLVQAARQYRIFPRRAVRVGQRKWRRPSGAV